MLIERYKHVWSAEDNAAWDAAQREYQLEKMHEEVLRKLLEDPTEETISSPTTTSTSHIYTTGAVGHGVSFPTTTQQVYNPYSGAQPYISVVDDTSATTNPSLFSRIFNSI